MLGKSSRSTLLLKLLRQLLTLGTWKVVLRRGQLSLLPRHHLLQLLPFQPAKRGSEASNKEARQWQEARVVGCTARTLLVPHA